MLDRADPVEDPCELVVLALREQGAVERDESLRIGCVEEGALEVLGGGQIGLPFSLASGGLG
jgi:hypothetical protein